MTFRSCIPHVWCEFGHNRARNMVTVLVVYNRHFWMKKRNYDVITSRRHNFARRGTFLGIIYGQMSGKLGCTTDPWGDCAMTSWLHGPFWALLGTLIYSLFNEPKLFYNPVVLAFGVEKNATSWIFFREQMRWGPSARHALVRHHSI